MRWYLHDSEYFSTIKNGVGYVNRFKNVCITDNEDWNQSDMFIWFRVDKATETADIFKARLIANAPSLHDELGRIGAALISYRHVFKPEDIAYQSLSENIKSIQSIMDRITYII